MSQTRTTPQNAAAISGTEFVTDVNELSDAIITDWSGTQRPEDAVGGTGWLDVSDSVSRPTKRIYDGSAARNLSSTDAPLYVLDKANRRLRFNPDTDGDSYGEYVADDDWRHTIGGSQGMRLNSSGLIIGGTAAPGVALDLRSKTTGLVLPQGNDSQAPAAAQNPGLLRYVNGRVKMSDGVSYKELAHKDEILSGFLRYNASITDGDSTIDVTNIQSGVSLIRVRVALVFRTRYTGTGIQNSYPSLQDSGTPYLQTHIQLGDSGGVETTGYTQFASGWRGSPTAGFVLYETPRSGTSGNINYVRDTYTNNAMGVYSLELERFGTGHTWTARLLGSGDIGTKTLSGALDRVRVSTNGWANWPANIGPQSLFEDGWSSTSVLSVNAF